MADDKYALPRPPEPERTQLAQHPHEQRRATIAVVIAVLAACFTGWQAWEAHQARIESQKAAQAQSLDIERSRRAAENSALAASAMASSVSKNVELFERSVRIGEGNARTAQQSLTTSLEALRREQRPILEIVQADYPHPPDGITVYIRNSGRTTAVHPSIIPYFEAGYPLPEKLPASLEELKIHFRTHFRSIAQGRSDIPDIPTNTTSPVSLDFSDLPAYLSSSEYDKISIIRLLGMLEYGDIYGNKYQLNICYQPSIAQRPAISYLAPCDTAYFGHTLQTFRKN